LKKTRAGGHNKKENINSAPKQGHSNCSIKIQTRPRKTPLFEQNKRKPQTPNFHRKINPQLNQDSFFPLISSTFWATKQSISRIRENPDREQINGPEKPREGWGIETLEFWIFEN